MRRYSILLATVALLAGCGGGGTGGSGAIGDVAGFIMDVAGNPVRDAKVFVDGGPSTYSNSAGSYVLLGVRGDERVLKATTTQDGQSYYGSTVVQIFDGERSKSANISVIPNNHRATLRGTVYDRNGFVVEGAHVLVAALDNNSNPIWSSTVQLTDRDGRFEVNTLYGGIDYRVIASARGFNSDTDIVNVGTGQISDLDFTLANPTNTTLPAPSNLEAITWSTPSEPTSRAVGQKAGIEAVKRMLQPKRAQVALTRNTSDGNYVEIDLDWTPMSHPSLLGFGIYRGFGDTNVLNFSDFYRDPQASLYEDIDESFHELETWSFAITAINTSTPDPGSESAFSNRVVAHTLDDMFLDAPAYGPLTFRWQSGSGATDYTVYVFDRFPSVGVNSIWSGTTASLQLAYSGPGLQAGRTYYYIVLGQANGGFSKTMSFIDSFVAP